MVSTASAESIRSSCGRVAPTSRSRANSRRRSAVTATRVLTTETAAKQTSIPSSACRSQMSVAEVTEEAVPPAAAAVRPAVNVMIDMVPDSPTSSATGTTADDRRRA